MILVDTTVWIDHFRAGDSLLARLLEAGDVLAHPWVTGELGLGRLHGREETSRLIGQLPQAAVATAGELLAFIEHQELCGLGIGYVDAQLLAATKLTNDARLWTRDRRLLAAAQRVGLAYPAEPKD